MGYATQAFKERLAESFNAISVGQTFTFRRTFTDGDVSLFCGVTGDYNPYHVDDEFARESQFGRRILPGLLTASMATHLGGMLGFVATEMSFQYLTPVFVGETVSCTVTIVEKDEQQRRVVAAATFTNAQQVEVIRGRFAGYPSAVRLTR